jgi:Fic family protein
MQVVSGAYHAPKVHFEAPPSVRKMEEMRAFFQWTQKSAIGGENPLPALARAGIAHLHFVPIHPFEDGNGRLARAIAERMLAQTLGAASLTALSLTIARRRRDSYDALERANKSNEVTDWLVWHAGTVLEAQRNRLLQIDHVIAKTRLLDGLRGRINERDMKVLLRMMRDGPSGFEGGMSAGKHVAITGTSPATATRDLMELVALGALVRTGEKKGTRHWLAFENELPQRDRSDTGAGP